MNGHAEAVQIKYCDNVSIAEKLEWLTRDVEITENEENPVAEFSYKVGIATVIGLLLLVCVASLHAVSL